jgi:hypothetical protein
MMALPRDLNTSMGLLLETTRVTTTLQAVHSKTGLLKWSLEFTDPLGARDSSHFLLNPLDPRSGYLLLLLGQSLTIHKISLDSGKLLWSSAPSRLPPPPLDSLKKTILKSKALLVHGSHVHLALMYTTDTLLHQDTPPGPFLVSVRIQLPSAADSTTTPTHPPLTVEDSFEAPTPVTKVNDFYLVEALNAQQESDPKTLPVLVYSTESFLQMAPLTSNVKPLEWPHKGKILPLPPMDHSSSPFSGFAFLYTDPSRKGQVDLIQIKVDLSSSAEKKISALPVYTFPLSNKEKGTPLQVFMTSSVSSRPHPILAQIQSFPGKVCQLLFLFFFIILLYSIIIFMKKKRGNNNSRYVPHPHSK